MELTTGLENIPTLSNIVSGILTNSIIKSKKEWQFNNGNRVNDIKFYKNDEFCVVIDAEMVKHTLEYALSNPDFN